MKSIRIAAVLLAAALFLLSGCSKKDGSESFTGIAQMFVCEAEITCLGQNFSAKVSKIAKTVYEFTFLDSGGREVLVSLSGGEVTMIHGEVSYSAELHVIPLAAPFVRISNVLDVCDGADSYGQVNLAEGVYTINSETEYGTFTITVDSESLLPLELNVPSADLHAEFIVAG